jgi:putative hydrolase of the HAD superfamily
VAWDRIDTVLLDLDGTLLDLAFDNLFWRSVVPEAFASKRAIPLIEAQAQIKARLAPMQGTLPWYCVDHWSRQLDLDIAQLKREHAHRIAWLAGAQEFLQRVRTLGVRLVLVTNAHPAGVSIKHERTQVLRYFHASFTSHEFGFAKESSMFWQRLFQVETIDPARCLFADDSLPVLRSARRAGIGHIYAVSKPASDEPAVSQCEFEAVESVAELLG